MYRYTIPEADANQRRQRPSPRRAWYALVGLVGLAVLAAACSGGSNGPGVASAGTTATTKPAPGSSATNGSSGSKNPSLALEYSQCMRSHGVADFPDPNSSGDISISAGPGSDLNPNNPTFEAAQQACQKYTPGANMTPAQKAQAQANLLKYAQCMRAHGIADFPDPTTGPDGAPGIRIQSGPGSDLDPNNATFQAAQQKCQKEMPGGGKGGIQIRSTGPAPGSGAGSGSGT